jgi:lipopolysaccharide/colanic/teichoic acid biosynthesis glycosyltransferase
MSVPSVDKPRATTTGVSALSSLSVQFLIGFVVAILVPALVRYGRFDHAVRADGFIGSFWGATFGLLLGLVMLRRVTAYPGTKTFGYILPSFTGSFGLVLAILLAFRIGYSRLYLGSTFATMIAVMFVLSIYLLPRTRRRVYVVPGAELDGLDFPGGVERITLRDPVVPVDRSAMIVADFRHDHGPAWERMLAEAAVQGRTVYHSKQLLESLTGRVSIEHLSENNFGSLLPNLAWRKAKRAVDVIAAILLLPIFLPLFLVIGILIRLDSSGPMFFRQERVGVGGRPFNIVKFRTMYALGDEPEASLTTAITTVGDQRVTRMGRWLRRTRIDELPQIFNILAGQMSWIGPRPEAVALSHWYDVEIPFYIYRHIVRPGITGWAQVNQGHVTDLVDIYRKLQFDFYYIKNFSVWIDILIALRTLRVIWNGFGSK